MTVLFLKDLDLCFVVSGFYSGLKGGFEKSKDSKGREYLICTTWNLKSSKEIQVWKDLWQ